MPPQTPNLRDLSSWILSALSLGVNGHLDFPSKKLSETTAKHASVTALNLSKSQGTLPSPSTPSKLVTSKSNVTVVRKTPESHAGPTSHPTLNTPLSPKPPTQTSKQSSPLGNGLSSAIAASPIAISRTVPTTHKPAASLPQASPLRAIDIATLKAQKKAQQRSQQQQAQKMLAESLRQRELEVRAASTSASAPVAHQIQPSSAGPSASRIALEEEEEDTALREAVRLSLQAAKEDEFRRKSWRELPQLVIPPLLKRNSSGRIRASAHPHSPQNKEKDKKSMSMARCPVCDGSFPMAEVDSHLDSCLTERALEEDPELSKSQGRSLEDLEPPHDTRNAKKRPLEVFDSDQDALSFSPLRKKPAEEKVVDADCMIVGESGFDRRRSYYFSEDDEQNEEDDEDDSEDSAGDNDTDGTPDSDIPYHIYHRNDKRETLNGLRSSAPAQLSPGSPSPLTAAAPQIVIPHSGGLFNIVQFKTTSDAECPICFEEFHPGQIGIRLTCLCLYHEKCISSWLERKPRNCPSHGDY